MRYFQILILILIPLISSSKELNDNYVNIIISEAINKKLYVKPTWKSLLHIKDKKSFINDPNFILSKENFSLKNELIYTIKAFFKDKKLDDKHPICKFPARFYWIKKELSLQDSIFPKVKCKSFNEYLKKAPADEISLVFASEDIKNPSSMMGHVFFKLSGKNYKNKYVEHAVSFFAVIDTVNPISLIIKSTITGMDSIYSLLPFRIQLIRYLEVEHRNVWIFPLLITNKEKKLIYYHIWELKDVKSKYYFTSYNCATVVYFILSLADPSLLKEKFLWVSPRDVIVLSYKHNLIKRGELLPSDEWFIRMLEEELSFKDKVEIKKIFSDKKFNKILNYNNSLKDFYKLKLIEVYSLYLYKEKKLSKKDLMKINQLLKNKYNNLNNYKIDISNYKSPFKVPPDSQVSIGYKSFNKKNFLKIRFLPASHTLQDDNREFMTESSLKIGEFSLLLNPKKIKLESFYVYYAQSLVPWDILVGGISFDFQIGIKQHYDKNLNPFTAINISGGLGETFQLTKDLYLYNLYSIGIGYSKNRLYPYAYPELGIIIYEIFNMKSIISYKYLFNQYNSMQTYHNIQFSQSLIVKNSLTLSLQMEFLKKRHQNITNWEITFIKYF